MGIPVEKVDMMILQVQYENEEKRRKCSNNPFFCKGPTSLFQFNSGFEMTISDASNFN